MSTDERRKHIEQLIERCHKIELAAAENTAITKRKNTIEVINDAFDRIRKNAPTAYIQLMQLAFSISNASVACVYGKLAGYAMMVIVEDEQCFNKIMEINLRKQTPLVAANDRT